MNKKRDRKGLPPIEPIYKLEDVVDSLKQFIGIGYERPYQVMPGVYLTFYDAGHILGSAITVLDIEDEEKNAARSAGISAAISAVRIVQFSMIRP